MTAPEGIQIPWRWPEFFQNLELIFKIKNANLSSCCVQLHII